MPDDNFKGFTLTPDTPATSVQEIIPSDVDDLASVTTALNVATPGTLRVTAADGSVSDITVIPGAAFPLRVSRVWATGTTATGIMGLT